MEHNNFVHCGYIIVLYIVVVNSHSLRQSFLKHFLILLGRKSSSVHILRSPRFFRFCRRFIFPMSSRKGRFDHNSVEDVNYSNGRFKHLRCAAFRGFARFLHVRFVSCPPKNLRFLAKFWLLSKTCPPAQENSRRLFKFSCVQK